MKNLLRFWLRKLLAGAAAQLPTSGHRAHLALEPLEDRTLLSLSVTSINRGSPAAVITDATTVAYTVTFNEAATGVNASDFQLTTTGTIGTTLTQVTPVSTSVYTLTVNGITGNGTLGLNLINNGTIHDSLGGVLVTTSFTGQVYTIEQTAPYVLSINRNAPAGPSTFATTVTYTITFSEAVSGVVPADFALSLTGSLATGPIQMIPVSGSVYTAIISGITGSGTLGLNLVDNGSIYDLAGNPLAQQNAPAAFQGPIPLGGLSGPISVALSDLTGDGKLDLLAITGPAYASTLSVMLGNGNGTFQAAQNFSASSGSGPLEVADLNGDGKPDAVSMGKYDSTVNVMFGNGNGTFQSPRAFGTGVFTSNSSRFGMALGDVTGDGRLDIVLVYDLHGTTMIASVLLNSGNGTFQSPQTFNTGAPAGDCLAALADVNGDHKLDLIVTSSPFNPPLSGGAGSGTVSVLLGNGNGTFQAAQIFNAGINPYGLAVADVNGDGKPDLIVTNDAPAGAVSVLLGNGDGTFQSPQSFACGSDPIAVQVADVNGDGRPDLIVDNYQSATFSVLLGNGNGTFQSQQQCATGFLDPTSFAIGDVNGDGKPDIAVGGPGNITMSVNLLLGNGDGTFQGVQAFTTGLYPNAMTIADVNGDGKPDLIVTNSGSNSVSVLLANGNGTFEPQQTFAAGNAPFAVAAGDLTDDGKLDLAVADAGDDSVAILLGNGDGTFQAPINISIGNPVKALAMADVNGDGIPDLLVGYYGNSVAKLTVLLGNGNGTFQASQTITTGAPGQFAGIMQSLAIGDVNGDGIPDLVLAAGSSKNDNVSILLGNGNGTFQAPHLLSTIPATQAGVPLALVDVNGDGKLDLVECDVSFGEVGVMLGNGNGTFQAGKYFTTSPSPYGVAVSDVNGDGKPDLVTTNFEGDVSVLLGNGDGTFQTQQMFAVGFKPDPVMVSDDNGRPDIIVANFYSNDVMVLAESANGSFAGQTYTIDTTAATHFVISGTPITATAGSTFTFTVTSMDQFNNIATGYSGTVHFSSSDPTASLPVDAVLTAGTGTFSATLATTGGRTLTVTDTLNNSLSGVSGIIAVSPAAANHFALSAPSHATASVPFALTVTAQDQFYNTAIGYGGTVHFSSSDTSSILPPDITLRNGVGTFSATLNTPGSQTITAYDTAANSITGRSGPIAVAAPATHFMVSAPTSTNAGNAFVTIVTALDQFNNLASGYVGTVRLTSSDAQATLAANATLNGGIGFFAAVLRTAGSQTLTATDTASSGIAGSSAPIAVLGLAANHLVVAAPANAITGLAFPVTVTAEDPFGNIAAGYGGTVQFTSSDAGAAPPPNSTLAAGQGVFTFTLKTPGTQTITATDISAATIAGTSNNIATLGLVVTGLTPTSTGFVATFNKPFDPTTINLYDTAGTLGPDDVLVTGPGTLQTSIHGSLIIDPTDQTISFVKTSTFTNPVNSFNPQTGVLAAGTYTVTFRSAANGFKDLLGTPLDGTASGNPAGSNYTTTFVVATTPAVVVGVPGFARGPGNTVNLPNNAVGVGLPISISNGAGVTSGKFTLQYNTALLSITGATVNSGLLGATLTLDASSTPGNAVIDFSSTTALPSGPDRLGGLVATVPNSAAALYKSKALLHFSSVLVNGSSATGADAVDVDAYFGDVNGTGVLSGGDAALISRVASTIDSNAATGAIAGFSAFPLADSVLLGDLSGSGSVNSASVTLMNSYLAGTSRAQIPSIPTGLTIATTGPDPSLSVGPLPALPPGGGRVGWGPGSTVIVPVNIDTARPDGSTGMTEAILAVKFDPSEFTVSAADVKLGSLPLTPTPGPASGERGSEGNGWQLVTAINASTGEIGIDLFSTTPIQITAPGSLVTITLHDQSALLANAPWLSLETAVNPTGQRAYQTTVADAQGAFVLHFAMSSEQEEVDSGRWPANSKPSTVDNVQPTGGNIDNVASPPSPVQRSLYGPLVLDQVFAELQPVPVILESTQDQPKVTLAPVLDRQAAACISPLTTAWSQLGQAADAEEPPGEFALEAELISRI